MTKMFSFYFFIGIVSLSSANVICNTTCGDNMFCSFGRCVHCIDCSLYSRQEKEKCTQNFNDCGDCLDGFKEELITSSSSSKKPCKRLKDENYCTNNESCPPSFYCFENKCAKCMNCYLYKRMPSENGRCATQPSECGPCLHGYYEVLVTESSMTKPCQAEKFAALNEEQPNFQLAVSTWCFLSIGMLAGFGMLLYIFASRTSNTAIALVRTQAIIPDRREAENESGVMEEETIYTSFNEEKQVTNNAIVFRSPTATYYPPQTLDLPPEEEEQDEEGEDVEPLTQHDEDTMPSSWTPNITSSVTFTGVLNQYFEPSFVQSQNNSETETDSGSVTEGTPASQVPSDVPNTSESNDCSAASESVKEP